MKNLEGFTSLLFLLLISLIITKVHRDVLKDYKSKLEAEKLGFNFLIEESSHHTELYEEYVDKPLREKFFQELAERWSDDFYYQSERFNSAKEKMGKLFNECNELIEREVKLFKNKKLNEAINKLEGLKAYKLHERIHYFLLLIDVTLFGISLYYGILFI